MDRMPDDSSRVALAMLSIPSEGAVYLRESASPLALHGQMTKCGLRRSSEILGGFFNKSAGTR